MLTLTDLSTRLGRIPDDHVVAEFGDTLVPVTAGPQSQGDVRIRPLPHAGISFPHDASWAPLTDPAGVVVVAGVHDHVLTAGPDSVVDTTTACSDTAGLTVIVVRVRAGVAYLWHPEHGGLGLAGPGRDTDPPLLYAIRRQREATPDTDTGFGLVAD